MQTTTILFDLDGTLTDPGEGVARCLRYALEELNLPIPSDEAMAPYIGPPLRENFAALCGRADDTELIERGVALYRERYGRAGAYENRVYDGIVEMLDALGSRTLYVATSKTQPFAELVLDHFALTPYFKKVHGGTFDSRLDDKAKLVAELMAEHSLDPAQTIMVGDRRFDIEAAQANGMRSIGVTWGYGSREELAAAGADHICERPDEVLDLCTEWRVQH